LSKNDGIFIYIVTNILDIWRVDFFSNGHIRGRKRNN
jgi:hypothetical protein